MFSKSQVNKFNIIVQFKLFLTLETIHTKLAVLKFFIIQTSNE